jgi:hypothetical protein
MNTAVTESARVLNPLSTAISNGIMRSIDLCIEALNAGRHEKNVKDLAKVLKLEHPKESDDFVMYMAVNLLRGK